MLQREILQIFLHMWKLRIKLMDLKLTGRIIGTGSRGGLGEKGVQKKVWRRYTNVIIDALCIINIY